MSPTQRILSLAFANSIGFSATTAMALWITTIDRILPVDPWWGSVVGSFQLGGAALANMISPYLFRRLSCEQLSKFAAVFAVVCGLLMAVSMEPVLFATAAIGLGVSLGVVLSGTNALLARSHHVQGNYATAQICEVTFSASFYLVVGSVIGVFGTRSIFLVLSLLGLIAFVLMHRLSQAGESPREAPGSTLPAGVNWRMWVSGLAFVIFFVGQSAFYQHQLAIGRLLGIEQVDMSRLMAVATMGGITGAVISKFAGVRFGVIRPLILTASLLAATLVVGVHTDSKLVFALCAVSVQALTMASVPYMFSVLAELDETGRFPSRGPAMLLIGVSGGPLLAELFLNIGGYGFVGVAGAVLVLIAGALFMFGALNSNDDRGIRKLGIVSPQG